MSPSHSSNTRPTNSAARTVAGIVKLRYLPPMRAFTVHASRGTSPPHTLHRGGDALVVGAPGGSARSHRPHCASSPLHHRPQLVQQALLRVLRPRPRHKLERVLRRKLEQRVEQQPG